MTIRHEEQTGWPSQVVLRQRIGAYARVDRADGFKIGITCDPDARAALYRNKEPGYREMVVLYRTASDDHVRQMERELTVWFRDDSDNERFGGAGPQGQAPYYLYIVLR